jgi:predicted MPP superfamily phosphohydrolase
MPYQTIIIAMAVVLIVLALAHWALYRTIVDFFSPANRIFLLVLKIGLAILALGLVVAFLLATRFDNIFVGIFYTGAMSWLGLLNFFILASILCWLVLGLSKLFSFSFDRGMLASILFSIGAILAIYGIINSGNVRINRISVKFPNLSASWRSKTAVWVSDTHLGQIRGVGFARYVASLAEQEHPDIFFIGGDLFDGEAADNEKLVEPFAKIAAPQGTYFITGNHEEFSVEAKEKYLAIVRKSGIRVLDNEMINLNGLQIIGVDYNDAMDQDKFKAILQSLGIDKSQPSILLKHAPFNIPEAAEAGISLQLSGHTHQGQLFLFKYITYFVYKGFDIGPKKLGDTIVYTSSGAGTWGPPMRVDTKPDIVVIKFE